MGGSREKTNTNNSARENWLKSTAAGKTYNLLEGKSSPSKGSAKVKGGLEWEVDGETYDIARLKSGKFAWAPKNDLRSPETRYFSDEEDFKLFIRGRNKKNQKMSLVD